MRAYLVIQWFDLFLPLPFTDLVGVGDFEELAMFLVFTAWGLAVRRSPAAHKRFMILGTIAIMGPAINRWPFPDSLRIPGTIAVILALPLLVVAYDLWSLRRVHRATIIATSTIVIGALTLIPICNLPIWAPVIAWIRHT